MFIRMACRPKTYHDNDCDCLYIYICMLSACSLVFPTLQVGVVSFLVSSALPSPPDSSLWLVGLSWGCLGRSWEGTEAGRLFLNGQPRIPPAEFCSFNGKPKIPSAGVCSTQLVGLSWGCLGRSWEGTEALSFFSLRANPESRRRDFAHPRANPKSRQREFALYACTQEKPYVFQRLATTGAASRSDTVISAWLL